MTAEISVRRRFLSLFNEQNIACQSMSNLEGDYDDLELCIRQDFS